VLLALCAAIWLDPTKFKDVAGDIVVYFGIQVAALLPAMIYAASILRPDGLTLEDVKKYRKALREQMSFWVALLTLDLAASILMIIGKATDWRVESPLPLLASTKPYSPGLVFLAALCSALAILRLWSFLTGVFSLLELNGQLTERAVAARLRDELRSQPARDQPPPFEKPPGYGQITSRH